MKLVAVTRINSDVGGIKVRAKKGDVIEVPSDAARVLLESGAAGPIPADGITHRPPVESPVAEPAPVVDPPQVTPLYGFPVSPDGTVTFHFAPKESPVDQILARARAVAKAIVAVVTPIATTAAIQAATELSTSADVAVAALATGVLVWLVPNKART